MFKVQFKPRDKKLNGNTVYDVELLAFKQKNKKEFKENAQEELDRYEQERNSLEKELHRYMQLYDESQFETDSIRERVKDLEAKNKYLYERGHGSEYTQLCKSVHQHTGLYKDKRKSIFEYDGM